MLMQRKLALAKRKNQGNPQEILPCQNTTTTKPKPIYLERHARSSRQKQFQCQHCDKTATKQKTVSKKKHCRSNRRKKFKCKPSCDYVSNGVSFEKLFKINSLEVHSRPDLELLKCEHCGYTTVYSGNMTVHSRQHCVYKTTQSNFLAAHSRAHTDELFKCQHCDYTTVYARSLKYHCRNRICNAR